MEKDFTSVIINDEDVLLLTMSGVKETIGSRTIKHPVKMQLPEEWKKGVIYPIYKKGVFAANPVGTRREATQHARWLDQL